MTKAEFKLLCQEQIVILDGATGTQLQKLGMPVGVCPEIWTIENKQSFIQLQKNYIDAGSNIIYVPSFGANYFKLKEYGQEENVETINASLATISREAVFASEKKTFIAGDLAPTGQLIYPLGNVSFEEIVNVYKQQVKGLLLGGVDLFVIETMLTVSEARAAIFAVRESCDLPIMLTMTFEENGKTLTGTSPEAVVISLQNLGIDALGINCSTGPDGILKLINKMKPYCKLPLIAKANAGLPQFIDGKTVFTMERDEFSSYVEEMVKSGVNIIGGCCGTDESFISQISSITKQLTPVKLNETNGSGVLADSRNILDLNKKQKTFFIGERINPTKKTDLQQYLLDKDYDEIVELAREQEEEGADLLDINIGMGLNDEADCMRELVDNLYYNVHLPLCIDSLNPKSIESALRIYHGRAIINSASLEEKKLNEVLPLAALYGAMIIALPIVERVMPKSIDERKSLITKFCDEARKIGVNKGDIIIDGLTMPISSSQKYVKDTLAFLSWCENEYKIKTVLGISNISYGLPNREQINSSFLSMAIYNGLTLAIVNTSQKQVIQTRLTSNALLGDNDNLLDFIEHFKQA